MHHLSFFFPIDISDSLQELESAYFRNFVPDDVTDFSDYIARIRRSGTWGDNLEIQAMSEIYERPIEVYAYSLSKLVILSLRQQLRFMFLLDRISSGSFFRLASLLCFCQAFWQTYLSRCVHKIH